MNDYDVSIFIIDKDENYIDIEEYETYDYDDGMFVCLTNEEMNFDYGFNNSIYIYKDWQLVVKKAKDLLNNNYGVQYNTNDGCRWQMQEISIPRNKRYRADVEWFDRDEDDMHLKHYLDGYLSCYNIMSNITSIKGKYSKEQYIPAIMTACYTKVEYNGSIYKGYLPSMGQLLFISQNIKNINDVMIIIEGKPFRLDKHKDTFSGLWWSSTEYNSMNAWFLENGVSYGTNKYYNNINVLPLFVL